MGVNCTGAGQRGWVLRLGRKELQIRPDSYALLLGLVAQFRGELFSGGALFPDHGNLTGSELVTSIIRQEAALAARLEKQPETESMWDESMRVRLFLVNAKTRKTTDEGGLRPYRRS